MNDPNQNDNERFGNSITPTPPARQGSDELSKPDNTTAPQDGQNNNQFQVQPDEGPTESRRPVSLTPPNQPVGRSREHASISGFGRGLMKSLASLGVFIFGVVGFAAILNGFVFQSYYVQGLSMTPTLENNDRLIISKFEKTVSELKRETYMPQRGQVVILDSTTSTLTSVENEELIKRVIGLPGDRIVIENGTVRVFNAQNPNGFDVDKQLGLNVLPTYSSQDRQTFSVPAGRVFVMGDNREDGGSYDSRTFGAVETTKIVGRLFVRILPFEDAKLF